jgi:hypothetical protein
MNSSGSVLPRADLQYEGKMIGQLEWQHICIANAPARPSFERSEHGVLKHDSNPSAGEAWVQRAYMHSSVSFVSL